MTAETAAQPGAAPGAEGGALRALACLAYERSPFYRARFDDAGINPAAVARLSDLAALPPLTRTELSARQQKRPPFADTLAVPKEEVVRLFVSGGPLFAPLTAADEAAQRARTAAALTRLGLRAGDVVDVTWSYHWLNGGHAVDAAARDLGCAVIPSGTGFRQRHADVLQWARASVVVATPTFAEQLLEEVYALGRDPSMEYFVRLFLLGGEAASEDSRTRVGDEFDAEVRQVYLATGTGLAAYECAEQAGLHLVDGLLAELVDPDSRAPVADGEEGLLLLTDTRLRALPLLRLDTGDVIRGIDRAPCPCGDPAPRIGPIVGAAGEVVRVRGVFVHPKEVARSVSLIPGVQRLQIVIERPTMRDFFTVRVEYDRPGPGLESPFQTGAVVDLRARLARAIHAATGLQPEIEVLPAGALGENPPVIVDRRQYQ